jgi:hypothetical protein
VDYVQRVRVKSPAKRIRQKKDNPMARFPNPNSFGFPQARPMQYESCADTVTVAQFFNAVYAWMAAGLGLTAVVAWWVSTRPDIMMQIFRGPVLIGLFIAQLVLVGVISAAVRKINAAAATALFMLYAALNGLMLAGLFLVYAHATLASAHARPCGRLAARASRTALWARSTAPSPAPSSRSASARQMSARISW